jgi:hypothetical protein
MAVLALAPAASVAAAQDVALTANVGWSSEYIFRGIPQKTSSASAGLDLTAGPLSAGTWAADVGDGNEVDLYGRVGTSAGAFRASLGGTGYFYTGEFDQRYLEGNLDLGYGPLTAAFALGSHDAEPSAADYWFLGLTGEHAGFALTVGHFDYNDDAAASGDYGQARYGFSRRSWDEVAWVVSDADLSGRGRVDHKLVLGIGKKFTLR